MDTLSRGVKCFDFCLEEYSKSNLYVIFDF